MSDDSIQLGSGGSYLFVGNSFTFGRVDPVMSYNTDNVRDLTAPSNGGTFTNTTGSNPYEPHPWGGVPGIFEAFASQAGLELDVAISARNAATLQGQYLNSNPAGWDLRGNVASQSWDTVVLQDNSTQALPSGTGSITFAAGSSTATLTIHPTADTKVETDETVGIQVTSSSAYQSSAGLITGTILNDDPTGPTVNPNLPTVTLVANPGAVLEDGSQKLIYTFTRTGSTSQALTVNFSAFRDGSTAPSVATGGDFENNANQFTNSFQANTGAATTGSVSFTSNTGSVVIPAGATSVTFTLDPRPDTTVENDESIRLTLSANANYNVGTQGPVYVTILNDDFANTTLPNISLNLASSSVYEDGSGDLVYQFTRSGSNTDSLTINFSVSGTATLPGNDFTVAGANSFTTAGAADPNLASFNTYAVKLAQYATTGAADGTVPANPNANAATNVYLYETWARPNMVAGAIVANTDDTTGAVANTGTTAPEYYVSLEAMTADLRAAYEGLAAANPIFAGVAPVGAAFLAAVQNGTAMRDPYHPDAGKVDLWWDDNLHASKYGSYLSGLTLFGTLTGLDPRSLGAAEHVAADLGITPEVAAALQNVAAATLGFSLNAYWTAPGRVTELPAGGTGLLATSGSFGFSDSDINDTHTVTVTPLTPGSIGTFTATLHTDTTGDGTGGSVNWLFTVDNADVASVSVGTPRVEHFLVTITDANGGTATRDIAVTINGTNNDVPVAVADTVGINEDTVSTTGNVLSNDTDIDTDDSHTVSAVNGSAGNVGVDVAGTYGTLHLNGDGSYTYTLINALPAVQALAAGEQVTDTFTYVNTDNHSGVSNATTLTVTVTGTNDAPVAVVDTASISEDAVSTTGNVLTNDTDVDAGDTHTVSAVNGSAGSVGQDVVGTYGTLHLNSDGTYTYTLDNALASVQALAQGATVTDIFTYTNTDNHSGISAAANLTVTITGTNDAPVAVADVASIIAGASPATGNVLTNDTDVDVGDTHTVSAVNGQANNVGVDVVGTYGTLHLNSDGSYTYTVANNTAVQALAAGQQATDTFSYVNTDNHSGVSGTANLVVTVTGTNPAPVITSFSNDTGTKGDNITADTTLTLSGTADAGSKLVLFDGTTQIGTIFADNAGNWTFNTATLATGFHSFGAVAYDAQNHASLSSTPLTIQVDPNGANHAPVVTANSFTLVRGDSIAIANVVSPASDADGDGVTRYRLFDDNAMFGVADDHPANDVSGYFSVNGVRQASGTSIEVTDLSAVNFTAGSPALAGGNPIEHLWVQAFDGQSWGAWTQFDVTERIVDSAPNTAPGVLVSNLQATTKGQVFSPSAFIVAAGDPDGDQIVRYQFWDDNGAAGTADDNPATDNTGYFTLNGTRLPTGTGLTVEAANLGNLAFHSTSGTDLLWVRVFDGQDWSTWKSFTITGKANAIPTVTASNQTVGKNATIAASALFTAQDSDTNPVDTITQVQFRDLTDTATSGYFVVNGASKAGTDTITLTASDVANSYFQTGNGLDNLSVRVFDGYQWSNWSNFQVNGLNHAPVVNVQNLTLAVGDVSISASVMVSATDSDGDAITKYQFWDDNQTTSTSDDHPAVDNTGFFSVNGVRQAAGTGIEVAADQLANTSFFKATASMSETIWVRAYDGTDWGAWSSFTVQESVPGSSSGVNHAPVTVVHDITAASHNGALTASSLFSTGDIDGDVITRVQFWDDHQANGTADDNPAVDTSGHFVKNGQVLKEGQAIDVAISDLNSLTFETGSGSDLLWARVFDGKEWSSWQSFHVTAPTDHAPVVAGSSITHLATSQVASAQTFFAATDPDAGDQIVKYQFWDSSAGASSAHFTIDGTPQAVGTGIDVLAANLGHVSVVAGSVAETDQMWVRAFDGTMWSDWHAFSIISH